MAGLPGKWKETAGGIEVRAAAADGLTLDGAPLDGVVEVGADSGAPGRSRLAHGERRLVVLDREGQWAVRVVDPQAPARRDFPGIDAFPYDPGFAVTARFRPYDEGAVVVRVPNADGVERELHLGGQVVFTLGGAERALRAGVEEGGGLFIVFADGTSGRTSYRFRFLRTPAPAADGSLPLDFNRTYLPPCAFTAHFLCPFPPPGNALDTAVTAGERDVAAM
ncbi:DUF1684 domain-containing protein [Streptomyces coryli]|uniref:DUF1684 domain-containing protein n=1 Tax=Streptomyces coryli TaxID=1128680 RepID=UPI003B837CBC